MARKPQKPIAKPKPKTKKAKAKPAPKQKNPVGPPTKYRPEYAAQAYKLALLGATDREMADIFAVAESTFHLWKLQNPELSESITRGKDVADSEIAESLYNRAKGYSHAEDKIFCNEGIVTVVPTTKHYPPDTQAASLWLRNRQSGKWRDKQEVDHSGSVTLETLVTQSLNGKPDDRG